MRKSHDDTYNYFISRRCNMARKVEEKGERSFRIDPFASLLYLKLDICELESLINFTYRKNISIIKNIPIIIISINVLDLYTLWKCVALNILQWIV